LLLERRGNIVIFMPFHNMNLLISFHFIFQDEESLGWEEVEHAGQEEDLEVGGWRRPLIEDRTPRRRGTRRVRGWMMRGWGDESASGSASTH
jgi:hypothetical protein